MKKQKLIGKEAFDSFYKNIYSERWENLQKAFLLDAQYVALNFSSTESYFLDAASVCASLCLPVLSQKKIADLCAAPGGKTLVLAGNLSENAILYANERSFERKMRLCKVLNTHLDLKKQSQIEISCSDASLWCKKMPETFDSILLDVPCSSERHVYLDKTYLSKWTPARTKSLAIEQWALLSSAWRLLLPDGFLLYSTCALSPLENDCIIEKLLKKFSNVEICSEQELISVFKNNLSQFQGKISVNQGENLNHFFDLREKTKFAYEIFPDSSNGAGPLYFCLIHKKSSCPL